MLLRRLATFIVVVLFLLTIGLGVTPSAAVSQCRTAQDQAHDNLQKVLVAACRAKEAGAPLSGDEAKHLARGLDWPSGSISYHPLCFSPTATHWAVWAEPKVTLSWLDRLRFWEAQPFVPCMMVESAELDRGIIADGPPEQCLQDSSTSVR